MFITLLMQSKLNDYISYSLYNNVFCDDSLTVIKLFASEFDALQKW